MEILDFSQPNRQSPKGIIVIFALNAVKFFRNFFAGVVALGLALMKSESISSFGITAPILALIGILIVLLIVSILKYLNFKFHLSDTDFHLDRGIINKESIVIPKSKIQNVYIQQNFLQQLINVSSLKIETAGDKKSEIEISALDKATALSLKKELFNKQLLETETTQITAENEVFFKVSIKHLLLEGVLQNHLASFAIMTSFVFGLYYQIKEFMIDTEILDQGMEQFEDGSIFSSILSVVLMVLFVLLVSILFSLLRIFIVNFDLKVIEHQKTIEISKGLLNKLSLSLTPYKIQNLVIKTNGIKQYFNLYSLKARQAMTNEKQSKNFGIIALEKEQLDYLVQKLLKDYKAGGETFKPEPYFKRILILRMLFLVVIVNGLGFLFFNENIFWINIMLIPMVYLFVWLRFKKAYYQISDKFITVGSGAIDTVTNILEISKIQAVTISQSIFQKRKQIASVGIHTASKEVLIPYVKESDARAIHDFLLFKVESQAADWM